MKANALPEDADALLALAEAVATVLSEEQEYLGIGTEVEALLRARIAAATFAINGYLAVVAGAKKSAAAQRYVAQAKARCDRSVEKLRRRLMRSIGDLCRVLKKKTCTEGCSRSANANR